MLKIVKSDEFKIHSLLACIDSPDNHTISILDEFPCGVDKLIATQQELVLREAPPRLFKTTRHPLARQFLEGVSFMHKHHIAHLDLKPDNIVITAMGRLLIIDYGVSVQVSGPESWIKGYRGTEGWVAPELEANPEKAYQPIRADLWSAGRVLQYFADRQDARNSSPIKSLAARLLSRNPQERPSLSMVLDDPVLELKKRKEEVNSEDVQIVTPVELHNYPHISRRDMAVW
jgi:serine/threonine protein kinase